MCRMKPKFDAFRGNLFLSKPRYSQRLRHFELLGFSFTCSPTLGYRYAYILELGGLNHGLIQYGGDTVGLGVYVSVTGSHSGRVRDSVRIGMLKIACADMLRILKDGAKFFLPLRT